MMIENRINRIEKAISAFAKVYKELENIQEEELVLGDRLIPKGDQKTGVIGEYFAVLYLRSKYPNSIVELCENHSQVGYDIVIDKGKNSEKFISVKTVSFYSKLRRTSPIKKLRGENIELHILSLDVNFRPDGYWIVPYNESKVTKSFLTVPKSRFNTGYKLTSVSKDVFEEFQLLVLDK